MKVLSVEGYINHETYGKISLTEKGKIHASMVYKRHTTLVRFLREILDVSDEVSSRDACLIEHDVSSETMEKIAGYLDGHMQTVAKE
jgi:Mn-dependent DtxR family transcriptional regulator